MLGEERNINGTLLKHLEVIKKSEATEDRKNRSRMDWQSEPE